MSTRAKHSVDYSQAPHAAGELIQFLQLFRAVIVSKSIHGESMRAWRKIKGRLSVRHRASILLAWGQYLNERNETSFNQAVDDVIWEINNACASRGNTS